MASEEPKTEHHHFQHTARAEEMTQQHQLASPETFIKQIPWNKPYTLSLGTPLLGLDPRSPSTWALYSEMLPFIFSETPSDVRSVDSPRHRDTPAPERIHEDGNIEPGWPLGGPTDDTPRSDD
jgi:hypothetical protein